jgi:hypothetical protein
VADSTTTMNSGTGGDNVAMQTVTHNAVTAKKPHGVNDQRRNHPANRYMISLEIPGVAGAGTNLFGLRKLNANNDVYIHYIKVDIYGAAAYNAAPMRFYRGTTVAGGTLITSADAPKLDSGAANNTLEVRTGAVTGTKANQPFMRLTGFTTGAATSGGPGVAYEAGADVGMQIRLTGDEGIICDQGLAGDTDTRYLVTIQWEIA